MKARLTGQIAQSNYTLVVAALLYVASFLLFRQDVTADGNGGILWEWLTQQLPALTTSRWTTLAMHLLALYMLLELDTIFALIRVRSLFQISAMLLLLAAMPALFNIGAASVAGMLVFYALFPFFFTYQNIRQPRRMTLSGLAIGLASLCLPHAIYLLAIFIIMMPSLRNLSGRNLAAFLWGAALPFFGLGTYSYCTDQMHILTGAFADMAAFDVTSIADIDSATAINLAMLAFITLTSMIYAFYTGYDDKIKTRFLIYHLCWIAVLPVAAAFVLPSEASDMMSLALMPAILLEAHTIVLLDSRGGATYALVTTAGLAATFIINTFL